MASLVRSPLSQLSLTELPTRSQVARHFLFLKENKYASNKDVIPELSETIIQLWNRSGIPTQSLKNAKTKLLRLVEEGSRSSRHGKQAEKKRESLKKILIVCLILPLVNAKTCQNVFVRKK